MQALHLLGVRHVLEVQSVRDANGHVLFEPADLVAQIAAMMALQHA